MLALPKSPNGTPENTNFEQHTHIPRKRRETHRQDVLTTPLQSKSRSVSRAASPDLELNDLESSPMDFYNRGGELFTNYQTPKITRSRQSSPMDSSPATQPTLSQQEPRQVHVEDGPMFHTLSLSQRPHPLTVSTNIPTIDLDLITPVDQVQPISPFSKQLEERAGRKGKLTPTNRHNTPPKCPTSRWIDTFPRQDTEKKKKVTKRKHNVKKFSKSTGSATPARPTPRAFTHSGLVSRRFQVAQKEGKILPDTPKKFNPSVQSTPAVYSTAVSSEFQSPSFIKSIPGSSLVSPTPLRSSFGSKVPDNDPTSSPFRVDTSFVWKPSSSFSQDSELDSHDVRLERQDSTSTVDMVLHPRRSLRQSISNNSLSHQDLISSYPRFLAPGYFLRVRESQGRWTEEGTQLTDTTDYFESHFLIQQVLGHGSFADAYQVQNRIDKQLYAVKKARQPYIGHRDRYKHLEEVEILWKLVDCPHVVQIHQAWEQRGFLYLQTELCKQSLAHRLENVKQVEEEYVWKLLAQICLGLYHIHDRGIIHLDLKPANILLTKHDEVKIADFGLATYVPVRRETEREGDRMYIAPEILNSNQYDKPADIFSLGLLTLEVAAEVVLPENGRDWTRLRKGDLSMVDLSRLSRELIQVIQSMLSPNPLQRPAAQDLISHPHIVKYLDQARPTSSCTVVEDLVPLGDLVLQWDEADVHVSLDMEEDFNLP